MKIHRLAVASKLLASALTLLMFGCSSDDLPTQPGGEGVMPAESTVGTTDSTGTTDTSGTTDASGITDTTGTAGNTFEILGPESTITGELAAGGLQLYKIDSGSDISLVSNSGNVEFFFVDEIEDIDFAAIDFTDFDFPTVFLNDDVLCWSAWFTEEDVCSATADDGDVYALLLAFEDSNYTISATAECSVENINRWVNRNMLDYYIYADSVPSVNLADYSDPSDLVRDLRFESLDPFSNIQDAVDQTNLSEEGIDFGLGFDWRFDDDNNLRILYVFDDGPFGRAGIKRGDIAVSINGELLSDMDNDRYFELIGTQENPVRANWQFIDGETGEAKTVSVVQSEFTVNSVLRANAYSINGPVFNGVVGYIAFKQFIEPSSDDLDFVIQNFIDEGVSELVLDLRYNGGGRIRVGDRLASQIAGSIVDGQLQRREQHNSKYSAFDYVDTFPEATPALDLNRVIVLTTVRTASASERLISELQPYFEVVTIGSTTRGKAFGSFGRPYCGKMLNAMQIEGVNANGVSVAGGISADCYAEDDTSKDFGLDESMFVSALNYIVDGSCQAPPSTIASRSISKVAPRPTETIMLDSFGE